MVQFHSGLEMSSEAGPLYSQVINNSASSEDHELMQQMEAA